MSESLNTAASNNLLLSEANKIISHKIFEKSTTYANLLMFLVDRSQKGQIPKEVDIAVAIFHRIDFDPSQNTQVRVYMYKLRKKIELYYMNNPPPESGMQLTIPKGSYKVLLQPSDTILPEKKRNNYALLSFLVIGGCTLFAAAFIFLTGKKPHTEIGRVSPAPFLHAITRPDLATTVVLGDYYLFFENDTRYKRPRVVRTDEITTSTDFDHFLQYQKDPEVHYAQFKPTTVPYELARCTKEITARFALVQQEYELVKATQFDNDNLNSDDLLVIGTMNTLPKFYTFPMGFDYILNESPEFHVKPNGENSLVFKPNIYQSTRINDYCLVSKRKGTSGNNILMIAGLWDTSIHPVMEHLLQFDTSEKLAKFITGGASGQLPEYYELLIQVNLVGNTPTSVERVVYREYDEKKATWNGF